MHTYLLEYKLVLQYKKQIIAAEVHSGTY